MKRIQTWEGPAAKPEQVALLQTPAEIKVSKINGRDMGNFLLEDLSLDYQLLPGPNTVVFRYETIWAKKTPTENGDPNVHKVSSAPQKVIVNAEAGKTYHFRLPELANRTDAEQFVAAPTFAVVDQAGAVIAEAAARPAEPATLPTLPAAEPEVASKEAPATNEVSAESATLVSLKRLWGQASDEERQAFLRWAFK